MLLAALADKAAAILTDQRAAFLRRQDANVEAAIEQARPVRREKRLAAILGNFTLARDPRIGPKYQIEVVPLALWRPAALCDGDDDEHAEPMHVPTQVVEAELAEQRRSEKGSELTQDEAEFVDSRFYRAKTDAAPAPSAAPLPPDPLAAAADMSTDPLAEAALQWEAQAARLVATAQATALAGRARALDEWTRHARARLRVRLLTAFVSAAVHGYADVAAAGWLPPPPLAAVPVPIDAALVRSVRAFDGRPAREFTGAAGWEAVEAGLEAYKSASLSFDGLVGLLAHALSTPDCVTSVPDVYGQLHLSVLERAERLHGVALSAEARAARERAREEARSARALAAEVRTWLARVTRAVEHGFGNASSTLMAYTFARGYGDAGTKGGGVGVSLKGFGRGVSAAAAEARAVDDGLWTRALGCLPRHSGGVATLHSMAMVAVARHADISVEMAPPAGAEEGASLEELGRVAAAAAREQCAGVISALRGWRRTQQPWAEARVREHMAERHVQSELLASLAKYLEHCGGSAEMITGWYTMTEFRKEGATAGTYDSYFFNKKGKRFRSRAEVARHFNLEAAPAKRESKGAEAKAADKAAAAEAKRAAKEEARAAKTAKGRAEHTEAAAPTSRFGRKRSAPSWHSDPYGAGAFAREDELRGRGRGVAVVDASLVDHGADSSATGTSTEVPLEELWKALEASASAASPLADEWPVGMRVEVQQESDVHFGAWFEATVYGHKAPDKLRVEYEELCEDDAEAEDVADLPGLKRDEIAKRVRPLPPQPADGRWLGALSVGDLVQLSYIGGWWDVKVLEVRPQPLFDEPQWIVKSVDFEAVHTVDAAVLRPHAQWDGASKAWRTPAAGEEFHQD
ncbi:hypothetical protein Ctob_004684 [Chrysochromulina tobinii]|uniref:MBD domain-containing protein n=1 Tax=Chrysochromulina tobinii TaxID=1460289 RepID=A0A0M0JX18_9EUKA|nr:hypothetical protein Ctob_004684 [Chrysochromulina tobinii]|eukprot:KOO31201.1 hypothetical protein Ctob_004684 [Chrysochromulina sp. CCMP291]